jgi:hypothetical protein
MSVATGCSRLSGTGEWSVGFPYASQGVPLRVQMVSLCRWNRNNCDLYQQSVEQLLRRMPRRGPLGASPSFRHPPTALR